MSGETNLSLAQRKQIFEHQMPSALQAEAKKIQGLISQVAKSTLNRFYEICVRCEKIATDKDKYGVTGLSQLSEYLGVGQRTLNKKIQIARAFSTDQVKAMSSSQNAAGILPGPYVLEELATVADVDAREAMFESWKTEALSRDGLRNLIAQQTADDSGPEPDADPPPVSVTKQLKKTQAGATKLIALLNDLAQIDTDDLDFSDESQAELVDALVTQLNQLSTRSLEVVKVLDVTVVDAGTVEPGKDAEPATDVESAEFETQSSVAEAVDADSVLDDALGPLDSIQQDDDLSELDAALGVSSADDDDDLVSSALVASSSPKKAAKKKSSKKAPAKKSSSKKTPAKKKLVKKTPAKKASTKKTAVKKTPAKKAATGPKSSRRRGN